MTLSDTDIREYIKSADIIIKPFDESKLKPASYTLSLSEHILIPLVSKEIDSRNPKLEYKELKMGKDGYLVMPGDFLLGRVKESLSLSTNICCLLDARTTLTRIGLNVIQGSTLTEPGQKNSHETLEISNIGKSPIRVYPGQDIVKGVFHLLKSPSSAPYSGKYVNQKDAKVR